MLSYIGRYILFILLLCNYFWVTIYLSIFILVSRYEREYKHKPQDDR